MDVVCVVCAGIHVHTGVDGKRVQPGFLPLLLCTSVIFFLLLETRSLPEEAEPHQMARAGLTRS